MELKDATLVRVPKVLNYGTVRNLQSALEEALGDTSRVIVLKGEEHVFCRGLDLNASIAETDPRPSVESFAACLETIRSLAKPVIAFVRGEAAGGGVGLAAACDGVLASTDARFTLPELLFGLTPAVILPYLAQRVNLQKLRWMTLRAVTLTAEEAVELGLADAVCPLERTAAMLQSWVRTLRRIQPKVVSEWKDMTMQPPLPGSKDVVELTVERLSSSHLRATIRTFLETGEAPWIDTK
jgi:enoyl-CoA hydratase/carnithine racemase